VNERTGEEKKTEFENDFQFIDYIENKVYLSMVVKELPS
jgi:hypothetical protein